MTESLNPLQPDSSSQQNNPGMDNSNPLRNVFARMTDGRIVNIFDAMNREVDRGERQVNTSLLKPGDIVAVQYKGEGGKTGGYMYRVDETEVEEAGINVGAPRQIPVGRFHGENLPIEVTTEPFRLAGSGWGHFTQFGVLGNGRVPKFYSDKGEFLSPPIEKFGVYHTDAAGEIRPVSPEQLAAESREMSRVHEARTARVKAVKEGFGFKGNFEDCSQATTIMPLTYEDDHYIAEYREGMALGNTLAVYDKVKKLWMEFGYFDFQGEGALKASFADLRGVDPDELFRHSHIGADHTILGSDMPVITFNTSSNLGINVINYRPGDEELGTIGIADYDPTKYRFRGKPSPNILLFPDGRVQLDHPGFFVPIEKTHPGALEKIRNAVTVSTSPDGKSQFNFNGRNIITIKPDSEIDSLITNLNRSTIAESESTVDPLIPTSSLRKRVDQMKQAIGRFIPRKK